MTKAFSVYLEYYVNEELERGNAIDRFTFREAFDAFEGGAWDCIEAGELD